jgi:hypothetical protein
MKATDSISVLLGLVWMQGNPGGSAHFPRPNKSRVELARGNPPHRLVIDRGGGPRPFHVVPWEIHPLVETSGTDSSSRSRLATDKATTERRRVGASKVRLFLRRRPNSRAGLYQSHRLHVPLLSHLSSLWRSYISSHDLLRLKFSSSPATLAVPIVSLLLEQRLVPYFFFPTSFVFCTSCSRSAP